MKCLGAARDEFIVREVARLMMQMRQKPHYTRKSTDLAQVRRAADVLEKSGRLSEPEDGDDVAGLRAATSAARGHGREAARRLRSEGIASRRPSALPAQLTAALSRSHNQDRTLQAPPLNLQELHRRAARPGADYKALRESLSAWWSSAAGRQWAQERRRMYQGSGAADEL